MVISFRCTGWQNFEPGVRNFRAKLDVRRLLLVSPLI